MNLVLSARWWLNRLLAKVSSRSGRRASPKRTVTPRVSFRPSLLQLEDRITPSSVSSLSSIIPTTPVSGQAAALTAVGQSQQSGSPHAAQSQVHSLATPLVDVTVPASATISFSKWTGQQQNGKVDVAISSRSGLRFQTPSIPFNNNATAADVASAVYAALPIDTVSNGKHSGGFVASLSPDGSNIIIKGYYDKDGNFQNINEPKVGVEGGGVAAGAPRGTKTAFPTVTYTQSYTYTQSSTHRASPDTVAPGPMSFNFAPSIIDGTSYLQDAATVYLTIDGTEVDVNELAGETYTQVAQDVTTALLNAGLSGVTTDGQGNVIVNQNFSGQPPLTLAVSLDSTTPNQDSWISVGVSSQQ